MPLSRFLSPRLFLAIVGLAVFLDSLAYSMLPPLMPDYARRLCLGQNQLGLLFGIYAAAFLAAALPAGRWCDSSGPRGPFLAGLAGFGCATCFFVMELYPLLLAARIFQGLGAAATWVSGMALVARAVPPSHRGRAMSILFACANGGLLAGPTFSGWMVHALGARGAFALVGAAAFLWLATAWWAVPRDRPSPAAPRSGAAHLRDGPVRILAGGMVMAAVLTALLESVLPLRLSRTLGMGAWDLGMAFSLAALVSIFTSPLAGIWTDRKGPRLPMAVGLILGGALLAASPFITSRTGVLLVMAALGAAGSLLMAPVGPALAARMERLGRPNFGVAFSLLNASFAVGLMVGPIVGSILVCYFEFSRAMLLLAAAFMGFFLPLRRLAI